MCGDGKRIETRFCQEPFWAHAAGQGQTLHDLRDHLLGVAEKARAFADVFGAGEWAYLAGLWHDLGKFSAEFQSYLQRCVSSEHHAAELRGQIDHTSAGAQHAVKTFGVLGHLVAHAIAGHHAGLLDTVSDGASLDSRLKKQIPAWEHGLAGLPEVSLPSLPPGLKTRLGDRAWDPHGVAFSFAFFVRMLFSCLVDADFLDTEAFVDAPRASSRPLFPPGFLSQMENAVATYVESLPPVSPVIDKKRRQVRAACLEAAQLAPGFFSLTVPTGGGKTLSSLSFALRHCVLHNLRRVVYVVPFTTIIEQNAEVFRKALQPLVAAGFPDPVVEHHSVAEVNEDDATGRLAAENWDAPLIATTSVQFYESLFASRPGRCRKLHNLARAVIVLDEVQKIPVDYLAPCLLALKELVARYGSSVVLCTATQPALHWRDDFKVGLEGVREIVPDPKQLYLALKRVKVEDLGALADGELAQRMLSERAVLCVVNTRRHARKLFELIQSREGAYHLSAAMCPQHRSEVLAEIRRDLEAGQPCRVVTTQLIEAGVDIDFPVVYRSLAGLDSVAQAAGRCNRNSRWQNGILFLFRSEHPTSERFLRDTASVTLQLLGGEDQRPLYEDLLSLEAVAHFFRLYYWDQSARWDAKAILGEFRLQQNKQLPFLFGFRSCADRFRLIEESGQAVVIPWGSQGQQLCEELRKPWHLPPLPVLRALQRYAVEVHMRPFWAALGRAIELVRERYPVLVSLNPYYDEQLGLVLEKEDVDPESLVI